ncbi:hypothetical protein EVAR_95162_1 [Eumeta japonica]|uniref:Uncharacterized protein n=1 Tax=Eumeta variegata TaxID=151549 RepID=A0A4C1VIC7_EUMVA|nr:hypothetical protein EVAR_95162_1 [Eumeta japonica]
MIGGTDARARRARRPTIAGMPRVRRRLTKLVHVIKHAESGGCCPRIYSCIRQTGVGGQGAKARTAAAGPGGGCYSADRCVGHEVRCGPRIPDRMRFLRREALVASKLVDATSRTC